MTTGNGRQWMLDALLPRWDYREQHHIDIAASPEAVYAAVRHLDISDSRTVRLLFALRGLPVKALTLDGMIDFGFNLLVDDPPRELLLGVVGQLWKPHPVFEQVDVERFQEFHRPGYVKLGWDFRIESVTARLVRLRTQTRVCATDGRAALRFAPYWYAIRPFSGWIRRQILDQVGRCALRDGVS